MKGHLSNRKALALTLFGVCAPSMGQTNEVVKGLADRYWEATAERNPLFATSVGDYRFNDRLDDVSEEGRIRWRGTLNQLQAEVNALSKTELLPQDALTRDVLARSIADALLRLEYPQHLMPLEPLDGPQIQFPLLLVSQPFRNAADYRAYIARLRTFRKQVTDHVTNMRAGLEKGFISPKVIVEKTIPQIRAHVVEDPVRSEFHDPIGKMGVLGETDQTALAAEIVDAITGDVVPGFKQLLAFVEGEYLPRCRGTVGLSAVPGGKELYAKLAYLNTTVRMDPEEIHALGLAEVSRIREEMSRVRQSIAFSGTLDEFIAYMRTDPARRFTSREELISAADAILQRTQSQLPRLFHRLPKADCVMKEIESFRAAASPVAYYNASPEDGSRPGYYYINTHAPQEKLRFTLEALSYHEAVPGHHLQAALDQENDNLPKFRRYGSFTAYVEGWALYTEKLGYEIGGYQDADSRYGQLTFEMWRACRLVVDTGMHVKGWSRQRAIDYMASNTSLARLDIESEIDRYIAWPGQALAYKIGELRFLKLRREAEQRLGPKFDVRAFHDALLRGGAMPIELLESRMRIWLDECGKQ